MQIYTKVHPQYHHRSRHASHLTTFLHQQNNTETMNSQKLPLKKQQFQYPKSPPSLFSPYIPSLSYPSIHPDIHSFFIQKLQKSLFDIYMMLNRSNVNLADSEGKLEEIERQLRIKLEKARELAAACAQEEHADKTQQELLSELENLEMPEFNPNMNYSDQYWKTYLQNEIHCALIREISEKKAQLTELISQIESLQDEHFRLNRLKNRKKNRRLAAQIEKSFLCPYDKCHRIYGSDVSLNLHIKLKHNGGNKTDREKLAEKICAAEENKLPPPPLTLNLPPGYLREYRKLYFQRDFTQPNYTVLQNYAVKKQSPDDSEEYS